MKKQMANSSYSIFNAMIDIVAAPGEALEKIKFHNAWLWWPLLISILLASGLMSYFYSWVDYPWLIEEVIRQTPPEDRAEAADAIRSFMSVRTSILMAGMAILLMTLVIYTAQASYLHLVNKLTAGAEISFAQWFSFSVWTAFVGVFGTLAAFVVMFIADSNQVSEQELQVLSLNSLLIHANPGDRLYNWANFLNLIQFWTLFLITIGFARWTGTGMVKSAIIAALPWVLIFGVWGVMA